MPAVELGHAVRKPENLGFWVVHDKATSLLRGAGKVAADIRA